MKNGWRDLAPGLALVLLSLTGCSARATDYLFPGALLGDCADQGNNNDCCDALTLAGRDTITIAAGHPALIRINGALTTGAHTQINAAGAPSALTLQAGAFRDDGFIAVDSATGDCISMNTRIAGDDCLSDTPIGGRRIRAHHIGPRHCGKLGRRRRQGS